MSAPPPAIPEVLLLDPESYDDARGRLSVAWSLQRLRAAVGREVAFVQENHVRSARGVLRGLHFQRPGPQGKLVRAVRGAVWDVALDLRRASPTCGRWVAHQLSEENGRCAWIPEGFAHGFLALTEGAEVTYHLTAPYRPEWQREVRWDDPALAIPWPLGGAAPILSARDAAAPPLAEAARFAPEDLP